MILRLKVWACKAYIRGKCMFTSGQIAHQPLPSPATFEMRVARMVLIVAEHIRIPYCLYRPGIHFAAWLIIQLGNARCPGQGSYGYIQRRVIGHIETTLRINE